MTQGAAESRRAIQAIADAGCAVGQESALHDLLQHASSMLAADVAVLLLHEAASDEFVAIATSGCSASFFRIAGQDALPVGLAHRTEPVLVQRGQTGALASSLPQDIGWLIAAPLLTDEHLTGMLVAGTKQSGKFIDEHLHLLQLIAERAASILEHARLFEQVRAGRERSQVLSQQLMEAQEAERRHLARELHDEIGQALTAIKINLQAVQRSVGEPTASSRLDESIGIVDRVLQQVRNMSLDLRPSLLDDLGLLAALRWYLDRQSKRAGFAAEFHAEPPDIRASANLETACFRVAQEALTNIVRHAGASHVRVELRQQDNELQLKIHDDGSGFDVAAARQRAARGGSLGLLGMQERVLLIGGRIDIDSAAGRGTTIWVRFPLTSALERRKKRRDSS